MIYVDSCLLIYAIEHVGELGVRARRLLSAPSELIAISPLVIHECLVGPLRHPASGFLDEFQTLFEQLQYVDIGLDTFLRAAEIRAAAPGLKASDALHLAAAQLAGCTALWTNDQRLTAASAGLAVDVIHDRPEN